MAKPPFDLRDILDSLPNVVFFKDRAGTYVGCNRAMELFLGLPREAILGRTVRDLLPAEEAQVIEAKDEELYRVGGCQCFDAEMRRQDGQRRRIRFSKALWIDAEGGVAGSVCQCQDITDVELPERERLEQEARQKATLEGVQERDAQFHALFLAGNGTKLLLSPEGGWILDANPAAEAFLGCDLATLRSKSIREFNGMDEGELAEALAQTLRTPGEKRLERFRLASGELRDVEVHGAPVEIKGRTYIWATLHDVTEGRRAMEALKASEERLQSLAESIEVIVLRFDQDGRCTYVNGHYERVTGLPPGPVLAQAWAKVLHPADRERILQGWEEARKLEQVHETEFRLRNARDQELWVLGRTTPERDAEGRVLSFLTTCTDITRFRRAEEALRQAATLESLGLMAGSISNDFNNILQAVWTSLDLLATYPEDRDKAAQALGWARGSLAKAKRITEFIQQYSGNGASRPVPVDLGERVAAFAAGWAQPTPDIHLETVSVPDLPQVLVDPDQLTQCLKAMVGNAVEALGERQGSIRVLVRRPASFSAGSGAWVLRPQPGEVVELVVENDGPSIPRENLQRIFDPYYTTKEAGRGLGLASVLGIVRAHRGGLWVESMPDRGVRIRIQWPVGGRIPEEPPALAGGPGAVLVVDDEPEVLRLVGRLLEDLLGRPVLAASSGPEAVELVRRRGKGIGAVLMDANMPGMDGTAAFQAIQALKPGLPGVLFSGCDEAEGRHLARTYGFAGFIKKPFEVEDLRRAFDALLPARA